MLRQELKTKISDTKNDQGYIIDCSGLSMKFGNITALNGIDLKIEYGENYGLLGPNGAGKTTLIRILCGLLKPTSGSAVVLGRNMPDRANNYHIGYMTQMDALYNDLSIRENIRFFASLYGLKGKKREDRIDEVLDIIRLKDRQDSIVATLSGGMRKRASMACVLVHRPKLLFLDEPTVGVDPKLRCELWKYFHELNDEGVTLIVSTHIMDEAEHCNRLAFISDGRKLIEGTPAELKEYTRCDNLEKSFLYFSEGEHGRA
ncbi:ABC transporter ATP-binding protein [Methanocella sp. CWC-04]|uniref:ABC transporter ATP-binding protein n=1 Tax=Methanooceanicella nereidis TaxID=2052831 RepID=A0AAP2W4S7_9EURY|nr:ABC transporter ATP-binding protein [Methanocella sp. CWC-04]MCD1294690.1 ABC transporter ATP-binding protein [Methanocella sp. CWC-04]